MVRFIACDLDGTLLLPGGKMPQETFAIIDRLYERGIIFAPASGRQLPNLKKLFAPVLGKIAIIAENGGLGWYGGEIVYSDPTPAPQIKYALGIIRGVDGLYPLLSCGGCAYYENDFPRFTQVAHRSYSDIAYADLDEVASRETVYKISVWDEYPPSAEHGERVLAPKIEGLRVMASGYDWLDVSVATANKGEALKAMLSEFGICRADCMAFGDHMNDYEMLCVSGQPYCTANAYAGLKNKIGTEIPSNAEGGVILKLKELLR